MKKILCTVITLVCAMTAFAQSARQIVSKMNEYLKISNTQGMYCTLYHVIPRAENPGSHNIYLLNNKYAIDVLSCLENLKKCLIMRLLLFPLVK